MTFKMSLWRTMISSVNLGEIKLWDKNAFDDISFTQPAKTKLNLYSFAIYT
jgi:hypothetical protein